MLNDPTITQYSDLSDRNKRIFDMAMELVKKHPDYQEGLMDDYIALYHSEPQILSEVLEIHTFELCWPEGPSTTWTIWYQSNHNDLPAVFPERIYTIVEDFDTMVYCLYSNGTYIPIPSFMPITINPIS
jgi:hypothetical protein